MRLDSPAPSSASRPRPAPARATRSACSCQSVTRSSPAEKAGIEEGNRIASINGVSLKLAAADVGDPDMEGLMSRRLVARARQAEARRRRRPARSTAAARSATMKVKTVDPDSLYATRDGRRQRSIDERATLGSASARPAAARHARRLRDVGGRRWAGRQGGHRRGSAHRAINGVDVRVAHDDAGDDFVSGARVSRLEREMCKAQARRRRRSPRVLQRSDANVKVTTVGGVSAAAAQPLDDDHPRRRHDHDAHSPDGGSFDGEAIGATFAAPIEKAQAATGQRLEDLGTGPRRAGPRHERRRIDSLVRRRLDGRPAMARKPTPAPARKFRQRFRWSRCLTGSR